MNLLRGKSTRTSYSKFPCVYLVAIVPSSAVRTVCPTFATSRLSARARSRSSTMASCGLPSSVCTSKFARPGIPRSRAEISRPSCSSCPRSSPMTLSEIASPELDVRRPRIRGGLTKTRAAAKPRSSTRRCSSCTHCSADMPRWRTGLSRMSRLPPRPKPAFAYTWSTPGISFVICSTPSVTWLLTLGGVPGGRRRLADTMPSSTIGRNCASNVRATNPAPMQSATALPSTRYGCLTAPPTILR